MALPAPPDPVALTQALLRCASVTPVEGGAIALLEEILAPFGFACRRADRGGIANLYARRGDAGRVFGFAGHTDVVPVGDLAAWSRDPFGAEIEGDTLYGRGATDMKSGVAAFVAAVCAEASAGTIAAGSVALLITGDEEGEAAHGTRAILDAMDDWGERLDLCLVGEPTSVERLGDVMKIGRRGSLNCRITARGRAGHVAYPERALNPLPALVSLLDRLAREPLDTGSAHFQRSTLALTSIDVGNPVTNVIPERAEARFNIRFNDLHTGQGLIDRLSALCEATGRESEVEFRLEAKISGESFLTQPGELTDLISSAVQQETGQSPEMTTGGGTSDARFITQHCPVVEFGLTGRTMHQVDERVSVAEIQALTAIYRRVLREFFAG